MELISKNTSKMFGNNDLLQLKNSLPSHYYTQFLKIWEGRFKKEKSPTRQNVYAVLIGKSENDKIIEVLVEIVKERKELLERLKSVTSHASEQEA